MYYTLNLLMTMYNTLNTMYYTLKYNVLYTEHNILYTEHNILYTELPNDSIANLFINKIIFLDLLLTRAFYSNKVYQFFCF
jgi:hypothetical protein